MSKELKNRQLLEEFNRDEPFTVLESPDYDEAIVGTTNDDRVVYDYQKMADCLMKNDGMSYEDAVDFIDYNTVRALPYMPNAPVILYPLINEPDDDFEFREAVYKFDARKEHERLVRWIRNWFDVNGPGCNAVIGLSGGKDSTICAALCVEALGRDRVIGVALPDMLQGINDADKIAEYFGIKFMTLPIGNACWHLKMAKEASGEAFEWSKQTEQNIPPRIRMTMLYAIAQSFNGRVCCTDNASENYIGYSTLFGDDAGSFSPFGELTVTEVRAIGDEMGIPYEWVHKVPDDGLPHSSTDEEKFGFTYEVLDKYIRERIEPSPEIKEKIDRMHNSTEFKRQIIRVPVYIPDVWQ